MSELLQKYTNKLTFPVDFPSQNYIEVITNKIMVIGLIGSSIFGLSTGSVANAFAFFGAIVVINLILVVPPYPSYNEHKLKWATDKSGLSKIATTNKYTSKSQQKGKAQHAIIDTDIEVEIVE